MDTRFGFVSGCAAIAESNMRVASRTGSLPPLTPPFPTTPQRGHRGTDKPLETLKTVTDHAPVRPRLALHRKTLRRLYGFAA